MIYNEEYYKTNNYTDYTERAERYYYLAKDLKNLLESLSLYSSFTSILDYGCAFGFLMEGFKKLGHHSLKVVGYDISKYAEEIGKNRGNLYLKEAKGYSEIVIMLDVLEHMTDKEIDTLLTNVESKIIIGRIPCADYNQNDFYLGISRSDPTHINCKDKKGWKSLLGNYGYNTIFRLNLPTIYDSTGVFSFIAFKDRKHD